MRSATPKGRPASRNAQGEASSLAWKEKLRSPGFACLLLALATVLVFLPVARFGFVNYDDGDYVDGNSHVQTGLTWANVAWAFTTGHASNWHPLTWLSHMLEVQVFGAHVGAYHLVSVGFHVLNTLLLFLLLRDMTGAHWRSAFVAGLFALHPLHVESVAWISERKDVLSTFFLLLTLAAYAAYAKSTARSPGSGIQSPKPKAQSPESTVQSPGSGVQSPASNVQSPPSAIYHSRLWFPSSMLHPPSSCRYCLALVFFALGLMAKPMLVTLPFLLLLLDYWPLNRLSPQSTVHSPQSTASDSEPAFRNPHTTFRMGEGSRAALQGPRPKVQSPKPLMVDPGLGFRTPHSAFRTRLLVEKAPFFLLAAVSSVITFIVQRKGGAVSTSLSFSERLANALVSYMRYLGKMLWPENLSVLYPHPGQWPLWAVLGSALLLAGICVVVVYWGRARPYLPVGWCWFVGTLVPVIGLVQVGIQSMADRYSYVPSIGFFILVAWGVSDLLPAGQARSRALAVAAVACLGACAALTSHQVQFWRDSEALFRHATEVTSKNYLAYNNLGFYLSKRGRIEEAMENYGKSLEINPAYEDALNNMGYALAGLKRYPEALPYYEAALRVRPDHLEVHNNYGNALSELGRLDEAIGHYRFVLERNPDHADAHNNLGIALAMRGQLDEAISHFRDAIRCKPDYASAHSNLGNALAAQQKLDEAIREYETALRLNPKDAQARNNLGNVLAQEGRVDEAIERYQQAIALNADNPEAHFNLGMALAGKGRKAEARPHFAEALRLKPDYLEAKRQLELDAKR